MNESIQVSNWQRACIPMEENSSERSHPMCTFKYTSRAWDVDPWSWVVEGERRGGVLAQGGDFNVLYPDVCVEGLKKDPF